MNQDSKLLTEAYLTKVVETAPSIKQIDDEIAALEREQDAAEADGDKGAARDLEHEIMELEDEKRRLALMQRNLRREDTDTEDQHAAWAQRDTDELEAMNKEPEDPLDTFDALLDGVIAEVEEQADEDDPKGMTKRREIGDLMVARIYRKLMGINSTTGYTHQGRVFDGDFEA